MDTTFWGPDFAELDREDPEIARVLLAELDRQRGGLQLIASENFTSPAVLAALGSTLANKYAEGYPGRRYYSGCEQADRAEQIAIDRATLLFGAEHANVQPHSGASANLAAFAALAEPGDTVLAMELPHGGHLTHGSRVNFSGKWFHPIGYRTTPDTELIDYDEFREIADEIGAYLMVDAAHVIGLVAGGAIPSPVEYADVVTCTTHKVLRGPRGGMILCRAELARRIDKAVFPFSQGGPMMHAIAGKAVAFREAGRSRFQTYARRTVDNARALAAGLAAEGMRPVTGGTDNHLVLADLRELGVTGCDAELRCERAGITLGKHALPYDPERAAVTSGVRLGAPAVTTQGMGEGEMRTIAGMIGAAVRADPQTEGGARALRELAEQSRALADRFPAYDTRQEVFV